MKLFQRQKRRIKFNLKYLTLIYVLLIFPTQATADKLRVKPDVKSAFCDTLATDIRGDMVVTTMLAEMIAKLDKKYSADPLNFPQKDQQQLDRHQKSKEVIRKRLAERSTIWMAVCED
jgi:hypothetical protein